MSFSRGITGRLHRDAASKLSLIHSCTGSGRGTVRPVRGGFTLIELLVVVAIIALLIAILVPALGKARYQARLAVCASHLRQIGTGIHLYANTNGIIPHGPDVQPLGQFLEANDGSVATNQIWTGPQQPSQQQMAPGLSLERTVACPPIFYCPGDDTNDPQEELAKISKQAMAPAFSSYLYRQLDETNGSGQIENLGTNGKGRSVVALVMDLNSEITVDPTCARTNHKRRDVNILCVDASVARFSNQQDEFSLRDQDLTDLQARRDDILRTADNRCWRGQAD